MKTIWDFAKRLLLVGLSVMGVGYAIYYSVWGQEATRASETNVTARSSNDPTTVLAGPGIVESAGGSVAVASPLPGVVKWVIGQDQVDKVVKKGDVLMQLDDKEYQAKLAVSQAQLASAEADLERTKNMPREEDLLPLRAQVREAQATLEETRRFEELYRKLREKGSSTEEEYFQKYFAFKRAEAQLAVAEAELKKMEAGAWKFDLLVKEAAVKLAESQVDQIENDLDRLVVRCESDAKLLKVDVRQKEYVGIPPNKTVIMLGSIDDLHVRVYLDEHDAIRFEEGARATARISRGQEALEIPLKYVRHEPVIIPKPTLTGEQTERVDVRVLPVIYEFEREEDQEKVYEGLQLDVYIDQS